MLERVVADLNTEHYVYHAGIRKVICIIFNLLAMSVDTADRHLPMQTLDARSATNCICFQTYQSRKDPPSTEIPNCLRPPMLQRPRTCAASGEDLPLPRHELLRTFASQHDFTQAVKLDIATFDNASDIPKKEIARLCQATGNHVRIGDSPLWLLEGVDSSAFVHIPLHSLQLGLAKTVPRKVAENAASGDGRTLKRLNACVAGAVDDLACTLCCAHYFVHGGHIQICYYFTPVHII